MTTGGTGGPVPRSRPAMLSALRPRGLVGRSAELGRLRSTWAAVQDGRPAATLLAGAAGAGKTRLAAEIAAEADEAGALVAYVSCSRELTPPNQPWLDVIALLDERSTASTDDEAIALPEQAVGTDPEERARQIRVAIGDALHAMANRHAVVVVVDDVHWAGSQTLATLAHVVERMTADRLWVVATYRNTELDLSGHLELVLADLGRVEWVDRIALEGLGPTEVEQLLSDVVGPAVSTAELTSYAGEVTERTAGNPFLVTELARDLALGHRAAVPQSVVDVLRQRRQRLSESARRILDAVAIAEVIDLRTLRSVLGPEQSRLGLREALNSGLISELDYQLPCYQFSHALIRDAVTSQLDGLTRAEIHLALADSLEATAEDHATAVARMARHYAGAAPLIGPAKAIAYGRRSATLARSNAGYREAVEALTLVSETLQPGSAQRVELLVEAADLLARDGSDLSAALDGAQNALAEAHDSGEAELVAEAAIALERLAGHLPGRPVDAKQAVTIALETSADRLQPTTLTRLQASLARAKMLVGDGDGARLASAAVATARQLGDDKALAHALEISTHNVDDPRARLDVSLELLTFTDDVWQRMWATANGVSAYLELGELAAARELLDQHLAYAETFRFSMFNFQALVAGAGLALVDGDASRAEALIEQTQSGAHDPGLRNSGVYGVAMFLIRRAQGRLEQIRPVLEHLARTPSRATWAPGLAVAYAEVGMTDAARAVIDDLLTRLDSAPRDAAYQPTLAFLADATELLGAAECARPLYQALLPHSGRVLVAGLHFPIGPADRALAALAHLQGDEHRATRHLGVAATIAAKNNATLWRTQNDRTAARLAEPADAPAPLRPDHPALAGLTQRELEVLRALTDGLSNKAIAERLFISPNTAANHVRSIMQKTGARNRTDAAAMAHRAGLR